MPKDMYDTGVGPTAFENCPTIYVFMANGSLTAGITFSLEGKGVIFRILSSI